MCNNYKVSLNSIFIQQRWFIKKQLYIFVYDYQIKRERLYLIIFKTKLYVTHKIYTEIYFYLNYILYTLR